MAVALYIGALCGCGTLYGHTLWLLHSIWTHSLAVALYMGILLQLLIMGHKQQWVHHKESYTFSRLRKVCLDEGANLARMLLQCIKNKCNWKYPDIWWPINVRPVLSVPAVEGHSFAYTVRADILCLRQSMQLETLISFVALSFFYFIFKETFPSERGILLNSM